MRSARVPRFQRRASLLSSLKRPREIRPLTELILGGGVAVFGIVLSFVLMVQGAAIGEVALTLTFTAFGLIWIAVRTDILKR